MSGAKRFNKIFLHIGLGKTGSTSIQQALLAGAKRLESDYDIHYPRVFDDPRPFGGNHTLYLRSLFIDNPETKRPNIVAGLDTPEAIARANEKLLRDFAAGFESSNAGQLLLSAEGIGHFNLATLRRIKTWLDTLSDHCQVIACLRHPRHALASEIQQRLKTGRTLDNLYRKPPHYQLRALCIDLEAVFGREALSLYDFASARNSEGGVVGYFLQHIGVSGSADFEVDGALNRGLSHEATLLVDAINRQRPLVTGEGVNPARSKGDLQTFVHVPGRKYRPPSRVYAELDRLAAADLEWLQANFDLTLDAMGAGPADKGQEADLSPETIDDLALKLSDLANLRAAQRPKAPAVITRQRKPLILHVGMGKTGTTSLQDFFGANRGELARRGVAYPELGAVANAHHLLSPHVPDYMRERWQFQPPAEWAPQLAALPEPRVLLSSEIMFSADPQEITAYFKVLQDYFEPLVVVYLRRQDHHISSQFNQLVKAGHQKRRIGVILQRQVEGRDYAQALRPWAEAVGDASVLVRPYEKEQLYQGDIRRDFMHHALGLEIDGDFSLPAGNPNPRFPVDVLEYKRNLNWLVKERPLHRRCNELLLACSRQGSAAQRDSIPDSFLGPADRAALLDSLADSNAEVARRFMGREDGCLFLEPQPAAHADWVELNLDSQRAAEISAFILRKEPQLAARIRALAEEKLDARPPFLREAAETIAASFTAAGDGT